MIFGALVAIQVALVASEPTVLLQTVGDDFEQEMMKVEWEGKTEDSMETAFASYIQALAHQEGQAPAFLNLLKSVTKKNDKGQEYLQLKPLVTAAMDTVRALMKSSADRLFPQFVNVVDHTFVQGPVMAFNDTLALFNDMFIDNPVNNEVMDTAIAVRIKMTADTMLSLLTKGSSAVKKYGSMAKQVLDLAKLAVSSSALLNQAHGKLQSVPMTSALLLKAETKLTSAQKTFETGAAEVQRRLLVISKSTHKALRAVSQSTIKDDASRERALARKHEAIAHIHDKLDTWSTKMEGINQYYYDNLNSLVKMVTDEMPESSFKEATNGYLHSITYSFFKHGLHTIAQSVDGIKQEMSKHSETLA